MSETAETAPRILVSVQPVAVDRATAASMLAMSVDSFERYVQPDVRLVRQGKLRPVPVAELERWVEANAGHVRLTGTLNRSSLGPQAKAAPRNACDAHGGPNQRRRDLPWLD